MKTIFYHTSGTRFKVGDILGGHGKRVFLHTNPVPHGTIQEIVEGGFSSWEEFSAAQTIALKEYWDKREKWNEEKIGDCPEYPKVRNPKPVSLFVYEMKPYNTPVFGNCNDEYIVSNDFVEVVRIVGNAKGILDNFKRKFGNGSKAWHFGAKARKPNKKK